VSIINLMVFDAAKLPTLVEVEAEARSGGEDISFPEHVDLKTHSGFLPVRAFGRDTGFEHYFEPVEEGALPPEAVAYGDHHVIARTGSDLEECRAAFVYFKVLARLTDAAYVYPDDAIIISPDSVQTHMDEQIAAFAGFIK